MLRNLPLIIFVLLESTAFCQSDSLKDFISYDLGDWPIDSSTTKYEFNRRTKLRSIEDCVLEINNQDLNATENKAIEKRMEDISIFLIHQGYPTFIIEEKDREDLKNALKDCIRFILLNKYDIYTNINSKIQSIFNAFNKTTLNYLKALECCTELDKLSLYLIETEKKK